MQSVYYNWSRLSVIMVSQSPGVLNQYFSQIQNSVKVKIQYLSFSNFFAQGENVVLFFCGANQLVAT